MKYRELSMTFFQLIGILLIDLSCQLGDHGQGLLLIITKDNKGRLYTLEVWK